ncbi:hypothetical protein JCM10207_003928 [Rhodosporidiobolus poonsookiae]
MRSALLLPLTLLVAFSPAPASARGPNRLERRGDVGSTVTCQTGTYQGKILSNVEQFLGVPFAQPPVGELRLKRPQPLPVVASSDSNYGAVTTAYAFRPRCIQSTSSATSEDCLYVNIYRNQGTSSTGKIPVMVYLFGGSFVGGAAASYSPTNLVLRSKALSQPVMVITLDYRLGYLGFGASDALREAEALNLGLHDQRQALRWVKENIASFGGDPDRILLFGQSAGAISVGVQLMAYGGNITELIYGAIMESGAPGTPFAFDKTSSYPAYAFIDEKGKNDLMLGATGCTGASNELECLRSASTTQILSGQSKARKSGGFPYPPIIDGEFLTDVPSKLFDAGAFAQLPMIVGTNLDEGPYFVSSKSHSSLNLTTDAQLTAWLMAQTPGMSATQAADFLRLYPNQQKYGSPYGTGDVKYLWKLFKRASSMFGDIAFEAPRRAFLAAANTADAKNQAAFAAGTLSQTTTVVEVCSLVNEPIMLNSSATMSSSDSTTVSYLGTFTGNITTVTTTTTPATYTPMPVWSYRFSQTPPAGVDFIGAGHGKEIPYVWATAAATTPDEVALRDAMSGAWIYFANNLNPNGPSTPTYWPQYLQSNLTQLQFKFGQQLIKDDYRASAISYINSNPSVFGQ